MAHSWLPMQTQHKLHKLTHAALLSSMLLSMALSMEAVQGLTQLPHLCSQATELQLCTGRDQAASGMGIYGPRTIFLVAVKGYPGTHEFVLQDDGKWLLVKETSEIGAIAGPPALSRPGLVLL